jgi:hypothetical protein
MTPWSSGCLAVSRSRCRDTGSGGLRPPFVIPRRRRTLKTIGRVAFGMAINGAATRHSQCMPPAPLWCPNPATDDSRTASQRTARATLFPQGFAADQPCRCTRENSTCPSFSPARLMLMRKAILRSLTTLEAECGIRVLYACESGSRAWGFASRDSDWDVRFFFVWPQREYLRVQLPADHMHRDLPGNLDITGWALRKALHHAAKSSASVLEWLGRRWCILSAMVLRVKCDGWRAGVFG